MKSFQTRAPSLQPRQQFLEWYHSSTAGHLLQTIEATYLLNTIKLTYNQKILQVGSLGSEDRYIGDEFHGNFALIDLDGNRYAGNYSSISAYPAELPVAGESIDVLVLPHLLEFEDNPHQALREAERVLKPEGQVVVLGFNPWSLQALSGSLLSRKDFDMKSRIGCYRLMDWLSLLKFEAEFSAGFGLSSSQTVFRPDTLLTRSLAHLATSYAVRAVKRTYTLIPIKPAWIKAPGLMPGRVIDTPLMRKCR